MCLELLDTNTNKLRNVWSHGEVRSICEISKFPQPKISKYSLYLRHCPSKRTKPLLMNILETLFNSNFQLLAKTISIPS